MMRSELMPTYQTKPVGNSQLVQYSLVRRDMGCEVSGMQVRSPIKRGQMMKMQKVWFITGADALHGHQPGDRKSWLR